MKIFLADRAVGRHTQALRRALLVALLCCCGPTARAAEFDLQAENIRIIGQNDWVQNVWGGYRPIRMTITNSGPARELEMEWTPPEGSPQTLRVRRSIHLDENATAQLTLDVPQVGFQELSRLQFRINGRSISTLATNLWPEHPVNPDRHCVSLLLVGDGVESHDFPFEQAVEEMTGRSPRPLGNSEFQLLNRPPLVFEESIELIARTELPNHWIAYSSVDLVAISFADLGLLSSEQRGALFEWSSAGGRLLVFGGGEIASADSEARLQFNRWQWSRSLSKWKEPDPESFPKPIPLPYERQPASLPHGRSDGTFEEKVDLFGGFQELAGLRERERRRRTEEIALTTEPPSWSSRPAPFLTARNGFGHIALVQGDLAEANVADWRWLLTDLQVPAMTFVFRHGIESGAGTMDFINLSIPGVQGVPTAAFLMLISLFAIAIGPINFFLLWRKQRLPRLIVSIPVLAISTCLLLFLYVAVAQGFGTKGRIRSVTWIDRNTNSATTFSRLSLYSGLTLARGLHFSNRTAVYPLFPYGETFTNGTVDWTDGQHLSDGWFNSRTRTQFVTVETRDNRHRFEVRPAENGLEVTNGFDVDFRFLVVTDRRGAPYFTQDLAAGTSTQMVPLTDEHRALIRTFHIETIPEPPDGIEPAKLQASIDRRNRGARPVDRGVDIRWSILERHLSLVNSAMGKAQNDLNLEEVPRRMSPIRNAIQEDTRDPLAEPHGFMAITDKNPGMDFGGRAVQERLSFHMVLGTW